MKRVKWNQPSYVMIKMDAEIGSYQSDDREREWDVARTTGATIDAEASIAPSAEAAIIP
jgi:hypothetical protein